MEKRIEKAERGSSRRWHVGLLVAALVVSGSAVAASKKTTAPTAKPSQSVPAVKPNPMTKLKLSVLDMPLSFEVNRGQTDANVKFMTQAQNFTVFLMPGETVLRGRNADVLRIKLQNANRSPKMEGENRQAKVTNYYIGSDRSKWLHGVPNFGQVRYRDVYSGIDMVYHSDQRQLEYDFVVQPGADPNQIRVAFEGASKMSITEQGELKLESAAGTSVNHKPVVYQTIDGQRKLVAGEFAIANNTVGFKLGEYDRKQPLVIDPSLQVISFFGGTLNDEASGIAVSAVQTSPQMAGVVFVGRSESATLPGTSRVNPGISWDAFATGLNSGTPGVPDSGGTTILWTTYFGGSGDDAARGVAMDNQGNVYVVGHTTSLNFLGKFAVISDAFLVKLAAAGGTMAGVTLYGGNGTDQGTSVALDYSTFSTLPAAQAISIKSPSTDPQVTPNVVIGGWTSGGIGQPGSPADTTKTPDGSQKTFAACAAGINNCIDGFVAIFSPSLALLHATYIGGSGNDAVNGVAADIWGNVYATGYATPFAAGTAGVTNFPVTRGIAQTTLRPGFDAAQNPAGAATAFVAKWACTTGSPAIGVPSPPFGVTADFPVFPGSPYPICGGKNTLGTLANSALFGGSAAGGTFINPQGTISGTQNPITEAGLAIAVDQNGWGQAGVAGIPPGTNHPFGPTGATAGTTNFAGFPDIVPASEFGTGCNTTPANTPINGMTSAAGNNGFAAQRCAVSSSNSATTGGFEPGLSGPHVYVAGNTASRDFVNSLVLRASCTLPPFVSGPIPPASNAVPPLCPVPNVFGAAMQPAGSVGQTTRPGRAWCDPLGGLGGVCPTGPDVILTDLRVKAVAGGTNSGQTQGWLASFQFPAVTQAVVTPPGASTTTVTTLNPPTIPNYTILQPATCPSSGSGAAACQEGGGSVNTAVFAAATAPATTGTVFGTVANFGCVNAGGVTCPGAFIGSWNAVAVDSDMQVYLIGQIGMSGAAPGSLAIGVAVGAPNRLALEIERISPYVNTPGGTAFLQPNFCPGPGDAPCAFPLEQFPTSLTFGTDFLVDSTNPVFAGNAILNSSFGSILPGAPPNPNPNQPGGLGNGIAVSPTREAFFVGTTTVMPPVAPAAATQTATATAPDLTGAGGVIDIVITNSGLGYTTLPTCTIAGAGGTGALCSLAAGQAAGDISLSATGQVVPGPLCLAAAVIGTPHNCGQLPGTCVGASCTPVNALTFICPSCVTAAGTGYIPTPTVTLSSPPSAGHSLTLLTAVPAILAVPPTPATQDSLGGTGGTNACSVPNCIVPGGPVGAPGAFTGGPEDVIYGALQFYDAIASQPVVNFTATVNNVGSIIGPNGPGATTGPGASAQIIYSNWQQQLINIPPGCTVTPVVLPLPGPPPAGNPLAANYGIGADGTRNAFIITPVTGNPAVFTISVNASAAFPGVIGTPGVVTELIVFNKAGTCTGSGGQPAIESWDPVTVTLTVSAPLNLSPENSFVLTSKLATGVVDQLFASGQQLVANQFINTGIDVSTANSNGPINFTAQIVPGSNWSGSVTGAVILPTPTDIIYTATGGNLSFPTRVNVGINTQVLAGLPQGTYQAFIMFVASPETPALPTSGSTACGASTVPVASGTTSAACVPISITITPNQVAQSAVLVFGTQTTTPQQTQIQISNPTATAFNFTAAYQPTPIFGTALPAANVFFVGTASTLTPATFGNTVAGTVPAGGLFSLPIQINPVGLPTGVFSGQFLLNSPGNAPTAQTTVPIIVYVGPHAGEDQPSGNGLGLMLPTNVPPIGIGTLASVGSAPGSPGSYPLTLSVPSGVGPNGFDQIANPTLIQVTGLNNVSTTAFSVNPPSVSASLAGAVTFTNPGANFGGALGGCGSTFAQLSALPGSPIGPSCAWSLWVDATSLNSTTTTALAACGGGLGVAGTVSFSSAGAFPFATLVVPLNICVSDFPSLIVGMPNTFPNPTFGPNGTPGGGVQNTIAQPSNLVPGFQQSIVEMVLASSTGAAGATAAPINLLTLAGNSSQVCKILDIHTNGGVVNNVTIAATGVQFATIQSLANVQGGALFLGPNLTAGSAPNTLRFNSLANFGNAAGFFRFNGGITGFGNALILPATPPFAAGPFIVDTDFQTFAVCVNTDPVGNVTGTFPATVTINGAGVGPITIPINMVISNGTTITPPPPSAKFSQIGVFRPSTPVGAAQGVFALDSNGNNAFDLPADHIVPFGLAGDIPVAGDWDGTGQVRIGVYRPSNGHWYLDMNNNGKWDGAGVGLDADIQFGAPTAACVPSTAAGLAACQDIPVVGDWGGTGVSRLGIFRSGQWFLDNVNPVSGGFTGSHGAFTTLVYGQAGDLPIASNWAGGTADNIGVYRRGTWYVDSNGDGIYQVTDVTFNFGSANDFPVAGNWNGVGPKRIGVFSAAGQWFLDLNNDHVFTAAFDLQANFGLPGDLPVVSGPGTVQP